MTRWTTVIANAPSLLDAIRDGEPTIGVRGEICDLPPLSLSRGQALIGVDDHAVLAFADDGIALSDDNRIEQLALRSPAESRCVFHDTAALTGELILNRVRCAGMVDLIVCARGERARITLTEVSVDAADATARLPRPFGNGVWVQQGALTIWNRSTDPSTLNVDGRDIRIGATDSPVRGTGLFVAGAGQEGGGTVKLSGFSSGSVYADSTLTEGTTTTVSGGIFFLHGVKGAGIVTDGEIVTHGANAVPVDNWGELDHWTIRGDVQSFGPSAVGFVNAGSLGACTIEGVLETRGPGARGVCVYQPMGTFSARSIRTQGRAAVGVQIVAALNRLHLTDSLVTLGEAGEGLVKGEMIATPAHGIEIEQGSRLGELDCGAIDVRGEGALPIHGTACIDRITRP